MTCNVILTAKSGRFIAQVAELPYCKAEANSRNQALALIQKRLEEVVKRSEIVQVKIAGSPALSSTFRKTKKTSLPQTVKVAAPISANDKTAHSKKRYTDVMIAAMALAGKHIVVTRNLKHFEDLLPPRQLD